jgi:hypothetical protein
MAADPLTTRELVRLARRLERLLVKRRRLLREIGKLELEVRAVRKLLSDLSRPLDPMPSADVGTLP